MPRLSIFGRDVRLYCLTARCVGFIQDVAAADEYIEQSLTNSRRRTVIMNLGLALVLLASLHHNLKRLRHCEWCTKSCIVIMLCTLEGLVIVLMLCLVLQRHPLRPLFDADELLQLVSPVQPKRLRAVLCLYGVIPRSISTTWRALKYHVVQTLEVDASASLDVYIFNLDVAGDRVDGVLLNQQDVAHAPYTFLESANQSSITHLIAARCGSLDAAACRFKTGPFEHFSVPLLSSPVVLNALRQLYSENRVAHFLRAHVLDYDVAIVCGADIYPALTINLNDVRHAATLLDGVYTTVVQDAEGYTNGFYIGHPLPMIRILRRWDELHSLAAISPLAHRDYERILKASFEMHHIRRHVTPMVFFKVRANGQVSWQGQQRVDFLSFADQGKVLAELHALKERLGHGRISNRQRRSLIRPNITMKRIPIHVPRVESQTPAQ